MKSVENRCAHAAETLHPERMMRPYSDDLKAESFVRAVRLLAENPRHTYAALQTAERRFGDDATEAAIVRKATVSSARTSASGWAADIAEAAGRAFFASVAEASVHGRLTQVPPNVSLVGVGTGATGSFTAEGAHAPATQMALTGENFEPLRVTALIVLSQELIKMGDPRAEALFADALRTAARNAVDAALISTAASSAVKPAGLLNGLTAITATSDPTSDLRDLVDAFDGELENALFVATPKVCASLNSAERPLIGLAGGEMLGAPVVASRNAPAGTVTLIDAGGIAFAEAGFDIEASTEAALQMADNPSATGNPTSLFQTNAVAIKLERNVNWAPIRSGSVAYISGAAW